MFGNYSFPTRFTKRSLFVLINLLIALVLIYHLHFDKEHQLKKFASNFNFLLTHAIGDISDSCNRPIGISNFPNLIRKFNVPRKNCTHLPRKMSKKDYDTFMRLLNLSLSVLDENEIPYTVSAGGLVGSYVKLGYLFSQLT